MDVTLLLHLIFLNLVNILSDHVFLRELHDQVPNRFPIVIDSAVFLLLLGGIKLASYQVNDDVLEKPLHDAPEHILIFFLEMFSIFVVGVVPHPFDVVNLKPIQ